MSTARTCTCGIPRAGSYSALNDRRSAMRTTIPRETRDSDAESGARRPTELTAGRICLVLLLATATGCTGDDTDRLGRIGRKTMARCDNLTSGLRDRVSAGIDAVRT